MLCGEHGQNIPLDELFEALPRVNLGNSEEVVKDAFILRKFESIKQAGLLSMNL